MKKLIAVIIGLVVLTGVINAQTNLATFTNAATIQVMVSDQTLIDLATVRKMNNITNLSVQQYAKTNSAVMVGVLAPEAQRQLNNRRRVQLLRIQSADDAMLNKFETIQ